jgi:hypothetical protein
MAWWEDLLDSILDSGGGGSSSSNAVATGGNANVTVNPTIVNSIDVAPLKEPIEKLAAIYAVSQAATIGAIDRGVEALSAAQAGRNAQIDKIAQFASLGALAFAVLRWMK